MINLVQILVKSSEAFIRLDGVGTIMTQTPPTGAEALDRLAGRDLNNDGRIVNLVICGNSKFYDYAWLENAIEEWVQYNDYPDLIILGGASGVDYLAERWADNNNVPLAVFTEAWSVPRPNAATDSGRPEAAASLIERMLDRATHMLAFPGPDSVWTRRMEDAAARRGIPVISRPLPT